MQLVCKIFIIHSIKYCYTWLINDTKANLSQIKKNITGKQKQLSTHGWHNQVNQHACCWNGLKEDFEKKMDKGIKLVVCEKKPTAKAPSNRFWEVVKL